MTAPRRAVATRTAADLARRFHVTLILAAAIGAAAGLLSAGFAWTVEHAVDELISRPWWVIAAVPPTGLILAEVLLRLFDTSDRTTADAYVSAYHQRHGAMPVPLMFKKLSASAASMASGAALGMEGPGILIGGSIGSSVQARFSRWVGDDDAKVLMVAGAAAGVAAVFKAPLTGVIFALEVPYRSDLARRALLPSLVAAGSAYVVFVSLIGTKPLLSFGGDAPFDLRDLGGGLLLGLLCGALARLGAWAIDRAKHLPVVAWQRLGLVVVGSVALTLMVRRWYGEPFHIGPGYHAMEWAVQPGHATGLLAGLFAVRAAATWLSIAGGGVGGLFIPLVGQGAILGATVQSVVHAPSPTLLPTVGIAAFLGAGYRTPLAGVAFAAEATGRPGFLVPALLAAAAAQLIMGRWSFSPAQRKDRSADVTPLTQLRIADVMNANPDTVAADARVDDVVITMLRANRRWAPVVRAGRYVGIISLPEVATLPRAEWEALTAADVARNDMPPVDADRSLRAVEELFRAHHAEAAAVVERGVVVGVITHRDLANVHILLERMGGD